MNNFNKRRELNDNIRKAHIDSKLSYCLYCGQEASSFCNSHSLPMFILKNIEKNGFVVTANNFFKFSIMDNKSGLKSTGTFKRICEKCDNEIFQDYENEEAILKYPTKKMMAQIDLKNVLKMYDKRLNELSLYNSCLSLVQNQEPIVLEEIFKRQYVNNLDLEEIKKALEKDKEILSKESTSSFELIYWKKLEYVCSMAFQGYIALYGDLNGNIVNDIYNYDPNYIIEYINVCIFPLSNQTVVMMFVNKDNKKYKNFIKQFKKLKENDRLKLIAFMIFNYSEDFLISPSASEKILENKTLDAVTQNTNKIVAFNDGMEKLSKKTKRYELLNYKRFPNVLGKEFSLK